MLFQVNMLHLIELEFQYVIHLKHIIIYVPNILRLYFTVLFSIVTQQTSPN